MNLNVRFILNLNCLYICMAVLYVAPCALGFYSPTGLMPCTACPIGYYQNLPGQTTCDQCPLGSTTSAVGAIDVSTCTSASESVVTVALNDVQTSIVSKHTVLRVFLSGSLCSSNPCQNGGTCNINTGSSSLTCSCPACECNNNNKFKIFGDWNMLEDY